MRTYYKVMQLFWLLMGIIITVFTTYKGFTEGFDRYAALYLLAALAFIIFLLRRFMMKRVEKGFGQPKKEWKK